MTDHETPTTHGSSPENSSAARFMARLLRRMRGDRNWRGLRVEVGLDRLPFTFDVNAPQQLDFRLFVGAIFVVLACALAFGDEPRLTYAAAALLIGLLIVGKSILTFFERRTITFDSDGVEVVEHRPPAPARQWRLPYGAYRGVLHREHFVYRGRRPRRRITFQIIELSHADPARTLPLLVQETEKRPRKLWENYARRFGLPVIEQSDDGAMVARSPDDLDKSIGQLAKEGKVVHGFVPQSAPPRGLRVAYEPGAGKGNRGERLRIVMGGRIPVWALGICLAIAALIYLPALIQEGAKPMLTILAGLAAAGTGLVWWLDRRRPRELLVTRRRVELSDGWRWLSNEKGVESLQLRNVESIVVRGRRVVIDSDKGRMVFGGGLSHDARMWLKDYLTAALATA